MNSHEKASSAASTTRRGNRLSRVRGAFVTRGVASAGDGSGAPSARGRLALLSLAALALTGLVLAVTSASASKEVIDYIGGSSTSGTEGGELRTPHGVAVNTSGAGGVPAGTVYVVEWANARVQRFSEDGSFVSAWGTDVIQAGKPGDLVGTKPFEICTVAADCKAGVGSGGNGAVSGNGALNGPQSIAVDQDTGNVYVADDNERVNEYTATGVFIRSFGAGVDETTAGEGYEVCPATDVCKSGVSGSGAGQIGAAFFFGPYGIAVSPPDGNVSTGTVYLADTGNRRVNTYDLDGQNPAFFGSATQFGSEQPRKIAVDSRGIVYASNSKSGGEIERYDSEDANGGGVGFLAPIARPPLLEGSSETATADLAVDPDSDGAGPEEDVLYVLRGSFSSGGVVQQFGPTNDPGLTAAPTAVDDTHGAGAGFNTSVAGLGLDNSSGRLLVSSESAAGESAARVYILDDAIVPGASIDPVTTFDAHSATFSGSVNPNGVYTSYRFEYVDHAEFLANGFANAQRSPAADVNMGKGESPVAVEQEVAHHLVPSTTYHVRLVAKLTYGATQSIAGPVTFTTPGAAPSFEVAANAGEEEATLRAAIDPEGQAVTNYHFDWGTNASYGNSTPAGTLPAGGQSVAVEELLTGLTSGQTYHYRLVATNATGTTTGPDRTFTATTPPQFPQRGYEIASHYPTGGVPIIEVAGRQTASEDGNRLGIGAVQPLPGSTLPRLPDQLGDLIAPVVAQYLSERGSNGWQVGEVGPGGWGWSSNVERLVLRTGSQASNYVREDSRMDPDDQDSEGLASGAGGLEVYQWRDGQLTWISRDPRIPVGTPQTAPGDADIAADNGQFSMSADGSIVVFKSQLQLLDADTTPESGINAPYRLYKWNEGTLSFIGARPDESVPGKGSRLGAGGTYSRYAVSKDGSRVIFSATRADSPGSGRALYVQTDGQPTVEATKEEGVPPLPASQPYDVTYRGAAADGSRVFFTSASRFTPDSGAGASSGGAADLYVYDVASDTLRDLTPRLDGIEVPSVSPATADQARVLGVAANSEDGRRVYFVADARYPTAPNPEGNLPSASGRNLYMAELDDIDDPVELRFIGSLGTYDGGDWTTSWNGQSGPPGGALSGKTALASPDGSVLGFASAENLTGQPLGGTAQLFAYNVESETLDCASCPSDGSLPALSANLYFRGGGETASWWQSDLGLKRWVSSDGAIFFNTATPLLPADQNLVNDPYEYRQGQLNLLTPGTGTTDSLFSTASRDGKTVFLATSSALVPQDKDPGLPKIYAARVGGGFPYVAPPPPCDVNAGACEGAPSTSPAVPGAGTRAFEGPGDRKPSGATRCRGGKRKVRRHGKTRCVKQHKKRTAKHNRRAGR